MVVIKYLVVIILPRYGSLSACLTIFCSSLENEPFVKLSGNMDVVLERWMKCTIECTSYDTNASIND
jgi:hypothetical protein